MNLQETSINQQMTDPVELGLTMQVVLCYIPVVREANKVNASRFESCKIQGGP